MNIKLPFGLLLCAALAPYANAAPQKLELGVPREAKQQVVSPNTQPSSVSLSSNTVDFGTVQYGTTANPITVKLVNAGVSAVNIDSVVVQSNSSNSFSAQASCPKQLAPKDFCDIRVLLTPEALGPLSALLVAKVGGSLYSADLAGTGRTTSQPLSLSKFSVDFSPLKVGTTTAVTTITLTNENGEAVLIQNISIDVGASHFAQNNNCTNVLNAGESCTVLLSMTPANEGPLQGNLSVIAGGFSNDVPLSGMGQ